MQDYSPSLSAEMKDPVQIFLYKSQFYKHKNKINKVSNCCGINSWLWHKVPIWHKFLFLFFLYIILVNVYLQLDTASVVIFSAHHFNLPFTFVLVAKDFDLPSSGGYWTKNGKQFRKLLTIFSGKLKTKFWSLNCLILKSIETV